MDLTPEREHRSYPKGPTRKQLKARADRGEAKVKKSVRAQCDARDGDCRIGWHNAVDEIKDVYGPELFVPSLYDGCDGPPQWAHLHSHRRSQTRGQAATKRHTTAGSLMLCAEHHQQYDAHQLQIRCLTRQGADGPLRFTRKVVK